jgi:hypothetical protein
MQIRAVLFFGGIPLPEQVDKIHAALMDDPDFKPEDDSSKDEAAWAVAWTRYKQAGLNQKALLFADNKIEKTALLSTQSFLSDNAGSNVDGITADPLGPLSEEELNVDLDKAWGGPVLNETPEVKRVGPPTELPEELTENIHDKLHMSEGDKLMALKAFISKVTADVKQGIEDKRHLSPQERGLKYDPQSKRWKRADEDFSRAGRALSSTKKTPNAPTEKPATAKGPQTQPTKNVSEEEEKRKRTPTGVRALKMWVADLGRSKD